MQILIFTPWTLGGSTAGVGVLLKRKMASPRANKLSVAKCKGVTVHTMKAYRGAGV